jgi:formylmethanofuran dehydrogenase subunit C
MERMFKIIVFFLLLMSFEAKAQYTEFDSFGSWSVATNWSNGIPTFSDDIFINVFLGCVVDIDGACKDLDQGLFGGLTIANGITLTVNGDLNKRINGPITNNGTIIIKGDINYNGTRKIEMGGSVTFEGGVDFNGFTIN